MDFQKRSFFVLSGVSSELAKILAVEFCKKFAPRSVVVLFDDSQYDLSSTKSAIIALQKNIKVFCRNIDWTHGRTELFQTHLKEVLDEYDTDDFDLHFIVHNEASLATNFTREPSNSELWLHHVQISLNVTVALNQAFLNIFKDHSKLIVNLTPSVFLIPFQFETLNCSAQKARDMYFRAMAANEDNVTVLNYRPGNVESFEDITLFDPNNNIDELDPVKCKPEPNQQTVKPLETINKLINTLECLKFSSGHDIDYNA